MTQTIRSTKQAQPFSFVGDDAIQVGCSPLGGYKYHADLFGEIESPSQFSNIVHALSIMEEDDLFELNINSNGGSVAAGDTLIHALGKCAGTVHMVATGSCDSMASAILLQADSFELSEDFSSLIHSGSTGYGSHYQEYKQWSEFNIKHIEKSIRRHYTNFLTEEEIVSVLDGKPVVLDAEAWMERNDKRNELLAAQYEAQMLAEAVEDKPTKKKAK